MNSSIVVVIFPLLIRMFRSLSAATRRQPQGSWPFARRRVATVLFYATRRTTPPLTPTQKNPTTTKRSSSPLLLPPYYSSSTSCSLSTTSTTATTKPADLLASKDCNIPPHIADRVWSDQPKLYQIPSHPLHTLQQCIHEYFGNEFTVHNSLSPIVSAHDNFDALLIPPDHVSRSQSDTYYLKYPETCLRCHTSAHQVELLRQGHNQFLCTGDVYRRDEIDKTHYPIFHQMEGVKLFPEAARKEEILDDLRHTLEGLAKHLFGSVECQWIDEYFPFTHPSLELEILYDEKWMEVLGCGVMRPKILKHAGLEGQQGWAFGLGLERWAMILFQIPDIRLFWSQDERFWNQFEPGKITQFQPYSKYPPCYKDVSFWITDSGAFHVHEVLDLTRQIAGDLVEQVELVDEFQHPKTGLDSHCYRVTYRSMDRSLTNAEIDVLQEDLRQAIANTLPVELR